MQSISRLPCHWQDPRWVTTTKTIQSINSKLSPKCWKNYEKIATYMHNWWSCYIQVFWKHIVAKIKLLTGTSIPL